MCNSVESEQKYTTKNQNEVHSMTMRFLEMRRLQCCTSIWTSM